jgi:hypothetical protein
MDHVISGVDIPLGMSTIFLDKNVLPCTKCRWLNVELSMLVCVHRMSLKFLASVGHRGCKPECVMSMAYGSLLGCLFQGAFGDGHQSL